MFLHYLATAQAQWQDTTQYQETAQRNPLGVMQFLPWIAIILVFYFLLIRPQAKRQKQQQAMLAAVKKGDKIITSGGIHGTIVGVKENTNVLILKIADNMKIEIERSSVGRVLTSSGDE